MLRSILIVGVVLAGAKGMIAPAAEEAIREDFATVDGPEILDFISWEFSAFDHLAPIQLYTCE